METVLSKEGGTCLRPLRPEMSAALPRAPAAHDESRRASSGVANTQVDCGPNDQVPRRAAGVYTIWRQDEFIYVGMSGRAANAEDFAASQGRESEAKGLWTRLGSHASPLNAPAQGRTPARATDAFETLLTDGLDPAQNTYNT